MQRDGSGSLDSPYNPLWSDVRLIMPMWLLILIGVGLCWPAITSQIRGRRCRMAALCPACGYDLRASPDRCPECGASTPADT